MKSLLLLMMCVPILYAYQAVQDDWTAGSGYVDPETSWDHNGYYFGVNVDCSSGDVKLLEEGIDDYSVFMHPGQPSAITTEDFNDDGYQDIAICHDGDYHTAQILFNLGGQGNEWDCYSASSLAHLKDIEASDVDQDGFVDLVFVSRISNEVAWARNNNGLGTDWTTNIIYEGTNNSVDIADLDNDGDADIITAGGSLVWIENLGGGENWVPHVICPSQCNLYFPGDDATAADIDQDGDLDIVLARNWYGDIEWYENQLDTTSEWPVRSITSDFDGSCVAVADINQDGYPDVAAASYENGDIGIWKNVDGTGTSWEEIVIIDDYTGVRKIDLGDIDNDGDIDFAATGGNSTDWWENSDGAGNNFIKHQVSQSGSQSLRIADLNGYGKKDLPHVCGYTTQWYNLNGHTSGYLLSSWLDTTQQADWGYFSWIDSVGIGNSISFIFRTADENWVPHPWSDTLYTPSSLDGILNDGDRYIIYKAIFECEYFENAASLKSVVLSWEVTGIEEDLDSDGQDELLSLRANPSSSPILQINLPVAGEVNASVYSLQGRLERQLCNGELSAGVNEFTLTDLVTGIYFCKVFFNESSVSKRFAVIE